MKCPNHSNYKGIKYPKSNCPTCLALYNMVQATLKIQKKFISITTPSFDCGLLHLLAEMSVVMLYGRQPEFFWRKNVVCSNEAKEHYTKIYKSMLQWEKNNPDLFEGIDFLFYKIYKEYDKRQIANNIVNLETNIIEKETIPVNKDALTKFLGEINDEIQR